MKQVLWRQILSGPHHINPLEESADFHANQKQKIILRKAQKEPRIFFSQNIFGFILSLPQLLPHPPHLPNNKTKQEAHVLACPKSVNCYFHNINTTKLWAWEIHPLTSSEISFFSFSTFLWHKSFFDLFGVIPRYFFWSYYKRYWFVPQYVFHLYIRRLIVCPATLLKMFMSFRSLLVGS